MVGDPDKLRDASDDELVAVAEKAVAEADFLEGDAWQALCETDTSRAMRGLSAQARKGQWSALAWDRFLWAAQKLDDPGSVTQVAQLLLIAPQEPFRKIASSASWWINEKAETLPDALLWPLWERMADSVPRNLEEPNNE